MTMAMTQPVIFGFIAACILAFLFAVADAERTNPCSETQYWVEYADGSNKCEDCPSCLPGQGLSEECGKRIKPSTFVTCQPCQPKFSFSSKDDTSVCALCSSCAEDQVVLRNCTPESDIKCGKQCSSMNRYYNDAKGECLPCSKCCGDDHDLVEVECQEKLGPAGSNMICSFDTSVNRCGKATNLSSQYNHTTIIMKITATPDNNYTSPSQGSKSEQTESNNLSQRNDQDFWTAAIIPVVILGLMVICGCVYIYKTGHPNGWCRSAPEMCSGALDADGAAEALTKNDRCYRLEIIQSESSEPLLKEVVPDTLSCICEMDTKRDGAQEKLAAFGTFTPCMLGTMSEELRETLSEEGDSGVLPRFSEMATKKDSKPLSSLLERESDLQKICVRLDVPVAGVGHYRAVALYYGYNYYEIVSVFEKHPGGPSRALIESIQAKKPELTVAEFASVVGKEANRNDVVKLLEEYDLN